MKYVTADQHFWHKEIIEHCKRPHSSVEKMHQDMIERWNDKVSEDDEVYVIGDFMWCSGDRDYRRMSELLAALRGTKHLILGNHDEMKPRTLVNAGFTSVHTSLKLEQDRIWLVHDPCVYCMLPDGAVLLHGHIHTLYQVSENERCVNVGVDVWGYMPIPLELALEGVKYP